MKTKLTLIIAAGIFTSLHAFGQINDQTGPAAKNAKPWNKPAKESSITVTLPGQLTGPAAKNHKPWNNDTVQFPVESTERALATGPAAKHARPERRITVDTKRK